MDSLSFSEPLIDDLPLSPSFYPPLFKMGDPIISITTSPKQTKITGYQKRTELSHKCLTKLMIKIHSIMSYTYEDMRNTGEQQGCASGCTLHRNDNLLHLAYMSNRDPCGQTVRYGCRDLWFSMQAHVLLTAWAFMRKKTGWYQYQQTAKVARSVWKTTWKSGITQWYIRYQ